MRPFCGTNVDDAVELWALPHTPIPWEAWWIECPATPTLNGNPNEPGPPPEIPHTPTPPAKLLPATPTPVLDLLSPLTPVPSPPELSPRTERLLGPSVTTLKAFRTPTALVMTSRVSSVGALVVSLLLPIVS